MRSDHPIITWKSRHGLASNSEVLNNGENTETQHFNTKIAGKRHSGNVPKYRTAYAATFV